MISSIKTLICCETHIIVIKCIKSINVDYSWEAASLIEVPADFCRIPIDMPSLTFLTVVFNMCSYLSDIRGLAQLKRLTALTSLTLYFRFCKQIADISVLTALEKLTSLTDLILDFGWSPLIMLPGCTT